ncbi:hypothetical protein C4K22_6086 [Pseudomonas chlororaphis subsp. aurantiaca]|uniref:Uncharacterized protein n=2 Tax=Pseudomonas chlororaphis TaxID=587753 RepID=A0A0D5XSF0_9PSED|nr:hypothetical protein PCL1606_03050 [Pseudomonas chlororaphis]AZD05101.1 hypothetical protein C4K27_5952 [Pseudomonas chlororaphis subsp. chlororaphis]AZD25134.1 hypothetical protein C4K24_5876 [Pseudomonas chlororaphis subsp. aurantiaca]AZD95576.1 hypothetical protein C4K13_6204 [Pseudomonas chlororaphis subsp. aureofaciens]AZD18648.1 hypothetical protein C4K25_5764 [Pseudomonas chlororaphis]
MAGNGQQMLTRTAGKPSPQNALRHYSAGGRMLAYGPRETLVPAT